MLGKSPGSILGFSLGLPLLDLGLLSGKSTAVVGEVVGLDVVDFDGIEEIVRGLRQEGVNADGERIKVGGHAVIEDCGVGFDRLD